MNLAESFVRSVEANPKKIAVFWGDSEISYESLWNQSLWIARRLQENYEVPPGGRVAIWMKNRAEFIPALFGVFLAGGVVVPINNFLKPQEVSYILNDAEVEVIISEESAQELLPHLSSERPGLKTILAESYSTVPHQSPLSHPRNPSASELAVIIYTSGTTGRPKGAMLSHANLLHNLQSCRDCLEVAPEDRVIVLLPMFHSFMLTVGILLPLTSAASLILIRSVHPPKAIFAEILRRKGTLLPAIPQLFRAMAHTPPEEPLPLRLVVSGAAPLPVEVLKQFEERLNLPILEGYGLSEASPVVTMNPIHGTRKPGSIGIPIPDVEVTIRNDAGDILPAGEVGELCVRGGNVMLGYWNKPEETEKTLKDNWLYTGDIGYQDADGYIFITDRKKDMLLVNGINVYPREIEELLYQFPGVKEAAVIGRPDKRKGEQPVAYIAPVEGTSLKESEILEFLKPKVADYKLPKHIYFLEALPRNPTGKILKTVLREMDQKKSD